jgi:hypothetical protein
MVSTAAAENGYCPNRQMPGDKADDRCHSTLQDV